MLAIKCGDTSAAASGVSSCPSCPDEAVGKSAVKTEHDIASSNLDYSSLCL